MAFVFVILSAMFLVGCTSLPIDIKTNADVTGNGTLAVQKGNYLYFVNGYTALDDMKDGDNQGGNMYSAIYRAKLDDNGNLTYDDNGKLKNTQRIVDKIVGYNKAQLYIFGDYIYYATPNTEEPKDSEAKVFELTDFYSAKLNGEDRNLIYKASASSTTQFEFIATENSSTASKKQVYLAIYQEKELIVVNCFTGAEVFSKDKVDSCVMPRISDYVAANNNLSVQEQTIYYTRDASEEEASSGNVLASVKLGENQETIIAKGTNTYAVSDLNNGGLLYTKKGAHDENGLHFVAEFGQDGRLLIADAQQVDYINNEKMLLCPFQNGNYQGVVFKNAQEGLTYTDANGENHVLLNGKNLTMLTISNGYLYAYDEAKSIYKIDYKADFAADSGKVIYDTTAKKDAEDEDSENWPEPYFDAAKNFSINGNHIYFFVKYTGENDKSGYYLNRVQVSAENGKAELVGVLLQKHIAPAKDDEE